MIALSAFFGSEARGQSLSTSRYIRDLRLREWTDEWVGFHPPGSVEEMKTKTKASAELFVVSNRESATTQIRPQPLPVAVRSSTFFSNQLGFQPLERESAWLAVGLEQGYRNWFRFKTNVSGGLAVDSWRHGYHFSEAFLELRLRKLVLSVGRKPIFWGQSFISPLMLSYNATPLDSIQLTSDPVTLPGFLSGLGQLKSEIFYSYMDSDRLPPHDSMLGFRLGWKPTEAFEANISLLYQFGGDQAGYNDSFSDYLIEFLGGRPDTAESNVTGSATNRSASFDFRYRLSTPWPVSLYSEQHLEDCCGSIRAVVKYRYSYVYGSSIKMGDADAPVLRLEYLRTSNLYNFHGKWPSAISNRGRELGAFSGRDSQVIATDLEVPIHQLLERFRISLYGMQIARKSRAYFDEDGFALSEYEASYEVGEWRAGGTAELVWALPLYGETLLSTSAGLERVWNRRYQQGEKDWAFAGIFTISRQF